MRWYRGSIAHTPRFNNITQYSAGGHNNINKYKYSNFPSSGGGARVSFLSRLSYMDHVITWEYYILMGIYESSWSYSYRHWNLWLLVSFVIVAVQCNLSGFNELMGLMQFITILMGIHESSWSYSYRHWNLWLLVAVILVDLMNLWVGCNL
jgi:hypothetical protein